MKHRFIVMLLAPVTLVACSSVFGSYPDGDCASQGLCEPDSSGPDGSTVDGARADGEASADGGQLDATTDGGHDDGNVADVVIDTTPACDPTAAPSVSPCVIDNQYGVFVAPTGSDAAAGTKTAPFQTIAHAIANAGSKRIYVCSAAYAEPLSLSNGANPVSIYGGFACPEASDGGVDAGDAGVAAWSYVAGTSASLSIGAPTYAVRIDGATKAVHLEDLAFSVGDAVAAGESSIAGFVSNSADVTLKRVSLTAGNGMAGAPGATPSPSQLPVASSGSGTGAATTCLCANGVSSVGGKGGTNKGGGDPGLPSLGGGAGGQALQFCDPLGQGGNGNDVAAAAPVAPITKLGVVGAAGWVPSAGSSGANGGTAQGGGGGNSGSSGGIGGGGACGGCGGAPGSAPMGGGASVALTVLESKVVLTTSKLTTKDAGAGGNGAAGQIGALGGTGGTVTTSGCLGGNGGKGGDGAASSGGAGGVSVGVLSKSSTAPVIDSATTNGITLGKAGAAGVGGAASNSGPVGVSVAELQP